MITVFAAIIQNIILCLYTCSVQICTTKSTFAEYFFKEQGFSISPETKICHNLCSGTIKKFYFNSITLIHFGLPLILPFNMNHSAAYLILNAMYHITHY